MMLALYRAVSTVAPPVLRYVLKRRLARGKEDGERLGERMGRAGLDRPAGRLAWIYGASVGEARSVLPLIERLLARDIELNIVVTTGTVTSARIMAERLPPRALHQFVPVDLAPWVRGFLDHWRPDLALWVELEIWPCLVSETARRGIPLALLNARMSDRSYRGWRRWPGLATSLIGAFDLVLAQSEADAERYRRLGARRVAMPGNLKYSAPALPADEAKLAALRAEIGERPVWLAASIHPGEDAVVAEAHRALKAPMPNLLTIAAPRHPEKGAAMQQTLQALGLAVRRRSAGEGPAGADIYVADTMGELGLFYRVAAAALVGGSLIPHGGQNPIEPALLGCPILHGPHMHNFAAVIAGFDAADAASPVTGAADLADTLAAAVSRARAAADDGGIGAPRRRGRARRARSHHGAARADAVRRRRAAPSAPCGRLISGRAAASCRRCCCRRAASMRWPRGSASSARAGARRCR